MKVSTVFSTFALALAMATASASADPVLKKPVRSPCAVNGWSLENSITFGKVAGTWNGVWYRYDAKGQFINTYTSTLEQKVENCLWKQINSYPQPDGSVTKREFNGTVIGPGLVEFDGKDDPRFVDYRAVVKEVSDTSLLYEVWHKKTGQVTYVETITVVSPNQRLRVGQRYKDDGTYDGSTTIVETRAAAQ